jgi:ATP-binding cassette subfamily C protein
MSAAPIRVSSVTGEIGEPRAGQPFSIVEPGTAWVVLAGKLDVFLVMRRQDGAEGARFHILRAEDGAAVLGLPMAGDNVDFLAVAVPGTRVLRIPCASLADGLAAHMRGGSVASLIEQWIVTLSAAASGGEAPPRIYQELHAGEVAATGDEPKPIMPAEGVVWVESVRGSARLLDTPGHTVTTADGPFPVSKHGWLAPEPQSEWRCFDTDRIEREDPAWNALDQFHSQASALLLAYRDRVMEEQATRVSARIAADGSVIDTALRELALPLRSGRRAIGVDESVSEPLLRACRAVGNAAGMKLDATPALLRTYRSDPIAAVARYSRVRYRRVILKTRWWRSDSGPMLAYAESDNRPIALLPRRGRGYLAYDAVERRTVTVNARFAQSLSGMAHVFYRPLPETSLQAADLCRFAIRGCGRDVFWVVMVGAAMGLLNLAIPLATGTIFDSIVPSARRDQLLQVAIFLAASAVATALFTIARSLAILRVEGKMDGALDSAVWDRLLSLPVPFFRKYSAGDLAMRSLGIAEIRRTLTGSTISAILSGIFSVFSFILLFKYSVPLACLACGLILVALLATWVCGYFEIRLRRVQSETRGRISGLVLQLINGVSKFRIAGAEGRAFARWSAEFASQKRTAMAARKISTILAVFNSAFPALATAAIFFGISKTLGSGGGMTTGSFLAFSAAFGQLLSSMLELGGAGLSVMAVVPLYERARPIFETLPEVDIAKSHPGTLAGAIEAHHLAFRYSSDAPLVLKDISFSIRPGEFVAFVGASGSGKSTLFRLLLGFEKPEAGAIYYDGQDLAGVDVQALRRQIGVVLQNGKLMIGDIFTNIVGSAPLTQEDAWEAARMAGFDEDLKSMPMGMHTMVAEGGGGLSGGQRQRLLIARAIVGKPRIVLFDEATSALDNQTQATVSQSLERLQATRIVIAHRLSTVMNADRILVIDKGSVAQSGTYEQLMREQGLFQELAKRQIA